MLHSTRRIWQLFPVLLGALLQPGCDNPAGPVEPPYLAIIANVGGVDGVSFGSKYTYHVSELSGTLNINERFTVKPTDTIIMPVKPATYRVTLSGIPASCIPREGPELLIYVPEGTNTALARYVIDCAPFLEITAGTDGWYPDASYIWRVSGPGGDTLGVLGASDTIRLNTMPLGDYTVSLNHVAPNCVVTSDGGSSRHVVIAATNGTRTDFRVSCSDEARRPRLLALHASYHDGASGFMWRADDPDRDIDSFVWDVTDCHGTSVLPAGRRLRSGLTQDRTRGLDTVMVFGAVELGMADADLQGRCTALRVADSYGNTTPVVETPISPPPASGPQPQMFNARFISTSALQTVLTVNDPAYAGFFAAAILRDGVLPGQQDGAPDIGVYNLAGYEGVVVPTVPLGSGRPTYLDYYAVILYLFDSAGNFRKVQDDDLFN